MRILVHLAAVLALSAAATIAEAACFRCEPILNVTDAPVIARIDRRLSLDEIKAAIILAGAALGWQIREEGPDKLVGRLDLRAHTAVVDIPYSEAKYSIVYKSSINLDEVAGQIHKNYNGWISNLTKGINAQLLRT